jgi:hypothetical protein
MRAVAAAARPYFDEERFRRRPNSGGAGRRSRQVLLSILLVSLMDDYQIQILSFQLCKVLYCSSKSVCLRLESRDFSVEYQGSAEIAANRMVAWQGMAELLPLPLPAGRRA